MSVMAKETRQDTPVPASIVNRALMQTHRRDALNLARRYVSGCRYAGAGRLVEVAREIAHWIMLGVDVDDIDLRKQAMTVAIAHVCRPRAMISLKALIEAADAIAVYMETGEL